MTTASHFRAPRPLGVFECLFSMLLVSFCNSANTQANFLGPLASTAGETSVRVPDCDQFYNRGSIRHAETLPQLESEWVLGNKLATQAQQRVTVLSDTLILQYVNRVEEKIVRGSELSGCFKVQVLVDPDPNAYSFPGGFIYITTGLIETLQNEGELACALAHETGHVTARHFTRTETRIRTWARVALFGGPMGLALRHSLGPLLTSKLLRNVEFDADRLGYGYVIASGYDPTDFPRMLTLAFPDDERMSLLDRLFNDHPSTASRLSRLRAVSRSDTSSAAQNIVRADEFIPMKTRLATLMGER